MFLAAAAACSGGGTTADVTGDVAPDVVSDAADVPPDGPAEVEADASEESMQDAAVEDAEPEDAEPEDAAVEDAELDDGDTGETTISERCFGDIWDPGGSGPAYDVFSPIVGTHCLGTNHQDIHDVRRVVFLGESVTSGTPPTLSGDYYRSRLADALTARFGQAPPSALWKMVNILHGTTLQPSSGDFACCSKWGARTDDLMRDNSQVLDCMPDSARIHTTLVIMTVGGNDIASIRQRIADGDPLDDVWAQTREFVGLVEETVHWLVDDPTRFPFGVYVVFANMFEFTDGTGDIGACTAADLGGFGVPISDPVRAAALEDMVIWANEQYMRIAVDTHTDMILMLEHFCGHGFHNDDPTTRCYRGPGTERWFDLTCIHPNPTGHQVIADMFMAVVNE